MQFGTSSLRYFILFFVLVLLSVSCSKKEGTANLSLDLSQVNSSLNTEELSNIFINVTNSRNETVMNFSYECDDEHGVSPSLDNHNVSLNCHQLGNIQLSLKGVTGATLIQVLLVYDGETTSSLLYGDDKRSLSLGDNSIVMQFHDIESLSQEGRVSGRYIPSAGFPGAGHQLTGYMDMSVDVASHEDVADDRPPMKLGRMQAEIFGGWTDLFVLDSVGFRYTFYGVDEAGNSYNGVVLFRDLYTGTGLKLDSPGLQPNGNTVAHFGLDTPYYDERDENFEQRNFETKIVGFFGDNSDGRFLCADSLLDGTVLDGSGGTSLLCKTVDAPQENCTTYYTWGEVRADSTAPTSVNGQSNGCSANPLELEVDLEDIGYFGSEFIGFYGPFEDEDSYSHDVYDLNSSTGLLTFKIASGVEISEVDVFVSADVSGFDSHEIEEGGGLYNCSQLPDHGFDKVNNDPVTVVPGTSSTIDLSGYGVGPNSGVAICPLRHDRNLTGKRRYYGSAIVSDQHDAGNAMGEPLIQLALYDSSLAVISGWEFGGAHWSSDSIYILPGVAPSIGNSEVYVVIENLSDDNIDISPFIEASTAGYSVVVAPASTPGGYIDCGVLTNTMELEESGHAEDSCAIRIDFSASSFGAIGTSFNKIFINASPTSDPYDQRGAGFEIAGGVYDTFYNDGTLVTVNYYAPPGEIDVKYVHFDNDSLLGWTHALPSSGDEVSPGFRVYHDCPTTITMGGNCDAHFVLDNTGGGITDGTMLYSSFTNNANSGNMDSTAYTGALTLNEGNPYDFNNISGDVDHPFLLTNNSSLSVGIGPMTISTNHGASANSVADEAAGATFCNSFTVPGAGGMCDFRVFINHDPGFGENWEILRFQYDAAQTYRDYELEITSFHQ